MDKWMIKNQKLKNSHDQGCIHHVMKNKKAIPCSYFELDQSYGLNQKGYWNCQIDRKYNFTWQIFPERKMVSGCELFLNNQNIISFKKDKMVPTIFHLTCLFGEAGKKQLLNETELWFYNTSSNKCIAKNAINNWYRFFNNTKNHSILKTQFNPTQEYFPAVHINIDILNIKINDEIVKFLPSGN